MGPRQAPQDDADLTPQGYWVPQDDPELAPMLEDIEKNGMAAMMKYWNDPATLAKLGEKMGDMQSLLAQSAPSAAAAGQVPGGRPQSPAPGPEINSLIDAAK